MWQMGFGLLEHSETRNLCLINYSEIDTVLKILNSIY